MALMGNKKRVSSADKKKKGVKKRMKFEIELSADSEVYVAGSFNDWDSKKKKLAFKKSQGIHSGSILLEQGNIYEYKFVIDGQWCVDPNSEEVVSNGLGSLNSVLRT